MRNQVVIGGELVTLESLRYTPAGVARVELTLRHVSIQPEAGGSRQVQCDIEALAFAEAATKASRLVTGQIVEIQGFLAPRSLRNRQLVLHVNDINLK